MAGVRSCLLRTLLGSGGVLQCRHCLVGFLQQRVFQCNAWMQCHACAPWQAVFHDGKVSRENLTAYDSHALPLMCRDPSGLTIDTGAHYRPLTSLSYTKTARILLAMSLHFSACVARTI